MAGKRVSCPKCKEPMKIPNASPAAAPAPAPAPTKSPGAYNPILDLLDEAGVKSTPRGPVCNNCGCEMSHSSMICIECGYNRETGEKLKTEVHTDEGDVIDPGKSDADKIMAKAEKELEDNPVSGDDQNFGDGNESYLIALVAIISFLILAVLGVTIVLSMDWIMESLDIQAQHVSLIMAIVMALGCITWISTVAFLLNKNQGIACVCSLGLYCVIFGFTQGSKLLMPTVGLLIAFVIGLASGLVIYFSGDENASLIIDSALALMGG